MTDPEEIRDVEAASLVDSSCTCSAYWQGIAPRPPCAVHEAEPEAGDDGKGR